jgi:ferredoxin
VEIKVSTAFGKPAPGCIGCLACEQICPVQKISHVDGEDGSRAIIFRGKERSHIYLRKCASCGKHFGPLVDLSEVMERLGETKVPPPNASVCPDCSRRNLATRLAERYFEQYELGEEG